MTKRGFRMQALIVLDVQKGILKRKNFHQQLKKIHMLMDDFKKRNQVIIATRHLVVDSGNIFDPNSEDSKVEETITEKSEKIIEKDSPNALLNKELQGYLKLKEVNHLFIVGFNAEYCCLFTSIAGVDRGFEVTYIEDASGTVNNGETYEMKNLDIVDFVGSVLDWSGAVEVLYLDEYVKKYRYS